MSQNFLIKKQHQLTKPQERFEILWTNYSLIYPSVLHLYNTHKFTEPPKWYQAKTIFIRSVACWSINVIFLDLEIDMQKMFCWIKKLMLVCMLILQFYLIKENYFRFMKQFFPFNSQYCQNHGNYWIK
jgi:hypothetical protein